jgi:D-inositol-3-phosphate glycosyltransferase
VDLSRFYPIPPDEAKEYIGVPPCDRMLLFVGRIEPLKGIDTLIQAFALLRQQPAFQQAPACIVVIGGDPDLSEETSNAEMARLQAMREQYGMEENVIFLGRRGQDTLPYYYSAAEAVVVPPIMNRSAWSRWRQWRAAPRGGPQVGGLASWCRTGDRLHDPVRRSTGAGGRLLALTGDFELRQRMGRQAAEFAGNMAGRTSPADDRVV